MRIRSGRVELEVHELASRSGPGLLLLHALYGRSDDWGEAPAAWPGAVYALDFPGHGHSEWVTGGAYTPEILAADVDGALAKTGATVLAGAGLGAYVALLAAGARRDLVSAALLLPGAGLGGGGALPDFGRDVDHPLAGKPTPPSHDPLVQFLDRDTRPVDYTQQFAAATRRLLLVEDGLPRPPWWEAARDLPTAVVLDADVRTAFGRLAVAVT